MLKKISIAVFGMAVSSLATAGAMGPVCTPGNVSVPCEAKRWDLGVQALYLRSVYGMDKSDELGQSPRYKEVKNDWNWGFRLEDSYHFNTGNDVTVNWMHFSTSITPTHYLGTILIPDFGLDIPDVPFKLINRNRLDQVNLVMGQHTDLGLRDKLRFYGGLQYANIQSTATKYYRDDALTAVTDFTFSLFDNTDFKGLGPVVGLDYVYDITNSLSVTANGAGSILQGTNRYHAGYVVSPDNLIANQVYTSKKTIVPSLEAKLGLNYAYTMPQGVANIEVGYQVVNYFNALQTQSTQDLTGTVRSVNYGLFGPYFGLKYVGNA